MSRGVDIFKAAFTPWATPVLSSQAGGQQPDALGTKMPIPLSRGDKNKCFSLYFSHPRGWYDWIWAFEFGFNGAASARELSPSCCQSPIGQDRALPWVPSACGWAQNPLDECPDLRPLQQVAANFELTKISPSSNNGGNDREFGNFDFFFLNPHLRLYLLIWEAEREKHPSVASYMHPDQGLNPQLRYVPWPGINTQPFLVNGMMLQPTELSGQGRKVWF